MKILDVTFKRKVNCSANICLWNHWDGDHLNYVHGGIYNETEIFYEDNRVVLFYHRMKIPLVPFLKISTIDMTVLKDKNTVKLFVKRLLPIFLEILIYFFRLITI